MSLESYRRSQQQAPATSFGKVAGAVFVGTLLANIVFTAIVWSIVEWKVREFGAEVDKIFREPGAPAAIRPKR